MRLPYWLRQLIDTIIGFHDDCICQYDTIIDWHQGKIVSIHIGGIEYTPRDEQ